MENLKIVLIEDDNALRENITILLQENCYKVFSSSDGINGLKLITEHMPDLIICDVMMKGIDGYEVLRRINSEKNLQRIPFIFLTAKVEKEDIRKGMLLGADDYIFKPYSAADLLNAIQTRLKKNKILTSYAAGDEEKENITIEDKKYDIEDNIFLDLKNNPFFLKIKDIKFIEANNQYTTLNISNSKKIVLRKSITFWTNSLPKKYFLRIHRSTIINIDQIVKIEKWFNNAFRVYIKDVSEPFTISKRYSAEIRKGL